MEIRSNPSAIARLGDVEDTPQGWRLRFVRLLAHPPARVWRALTEPAELDSWFPTTIDGERAAGAPLTFRFRENQAPPFDGNDGRLRDAATAGIHVGHRPDPHRAGAANGVDSETRLTLYDTLDERGKAARDGAGWHVCLDELEAALGELRRRRAGRVDGLDRACTRVHRPLRSGAPRPSEPPEGFELVATQRATRSSSFDSLCATAAAMNARKSGCAFVGREVNSG